MDVTPRRNLLELEEGAPRVGERAGGWERRLLGHLLLHKNFTFSAAYLFSTLHSQQTWNGFKEIKKLSKEEEEETENRVMNESALPVVLSLSDSSSVALPPPLSLPLSQSN